MWREGDVVVRSEVLNDGRAWCEIPVVVVRDEPQLLATYIASGAPLRFPPGPWPTADGLHPWHGKNAWRGHGVLTLQRPGDAHAVWVFWTGRKREFSGWYVNFQEPFRRTPTGYATQDFELDIWIPRDRPWQWKDEELLDERVREGRLTPEQASEVRAEAERVGRDLDARRYWWDESWAAWEPDPSWPTPDFP